MPKTLLDAFSMAGANLTTVSGYISVASVYIFLALSIYAALMGSSIIAKEERDKTAEFFMVLPISRIRVITTKWIAAIICNIVVNISTVIAIYGATIQYNKIDEFNKFMALLMLGIFICQIMFMSIGMLMSAVMKRYKKSGTYTIGLLLILYLASIFASLSESLANLKYITPFKYFEASYILREMNYEPKYLIISLTVIAISMIATYLIYPKRDLKI
jgi:ABC-2 type transport system permease protein